MPNESIRIYINIYTIVGGLGALFFFLIYAKKAATAKIKIAGYGLLLIYTFASIPLNGFWASALVYPLLLIFNDYIVSQSNISSGSRSYRYFLIISALPFLIFQNQFELLFQIRVIGLAAILFYYTINTSYVESLEVKSTWKYIIFNYSFYYIPLLLIANIPYSPSAMKAWYIFVQGGLVVYLKFLDYALRKNHAVSPNLNNLILLASVGAPILPTVLFPSGLGLVIYFTGLLGLIYSKRYISLREI